MCPEEGAFAKESARGVEVGQHGPQHERGGGLRMSGRYRARQRVRYYVAASALMATNL